MTSEQRNYIEVLTFLKDQEVHKFPMSSFEAWVEYQCPKISLHGMTTVQITEEGRISIVGEKFDIAGIHTDFSTRYQTCKYNRKDRKLTIAGNSDIMNGDYTVSISIE